MGSIRAIGVCVAAAALFGSAPAAAEVPAVATGVREPVRLLDVPYVPQSGALCGGAALAMVLRYWGATGVLAEDFAKLVEPDRDGIRTGVLVDAVETYGWTALPLSGTAAEVAVQLAQGRPVIALIRAGADAYHYVVIVAWTEGLVVLHDPNVGPFRTMPEGEFAAAWSGSERWALLVLPPPATEELGAQGAATADPAATAAPDSCRAMVEAGISLARQGHTEEAERAFLAAQSSCPADAAPLRERSGLRFRAGDWTGAVRLAESALALAPSDVPARRLLAGSRFLAGDVDGALLAWNHLSEPLTDLTRIDGLMRTRYSVVAVQVDLPPGRLLTPHAFRRAHRRLADLPTLSEFRLSLRPLPDGHAQVDLALLERPLVFGGPWDIGRAGVKALTDREITLEVASPTGNGELWSAGWRWWRDRPRVSVGLAVPAAGGRPGIWRLAGFWERQTYATAALPVTDGAAPGEVIREERRRTALSFSDWLGPDIRLQVGAAMDEWADRGASLSLDGAVETRWARDRLSLEGWVARWVSLKGGAAFGAGGLSCRMSSSGLESRDACLGELGISSATAEAPLALWSGAGTGSGRAALLRAHPLLSGGVLQGRVFGRTLVHGTIEKQAWPWRVGPLRMGWAVFVDAAKPLEAGRAERVRWQADGGAGLRLRGPGIKGRIRIDAAGGFVDGDTAVSIGWQVP